MMIGCNFPSFYVSFRCFSVPIRHSGTLAVKLKNKRAVWLNIKILMVPSVQYKLHKYALSVWGLKTLVWLSLRDEYGTRSIK